MLVPSDWLDIMYTPPPLTPQKSVEVEVLLQLAEGGKLRQLNQAVFKFEGSNLNIDNPIVYLLKGMNDICFIIHLWNIVVTVKVCLSSADHVGGLSGEKEQDINKPHTCIVMETLHCHRNISDLLFWLPFWKRHNVIQYNCSWVDTVLPGNRRRCEVCNRLITQTVPWWAAA